MTVAKNIFTVKDDPTGQTFTVYRDTNNLLHATLARKEVVTATSTEDGGIGNFPVAGNSTLHGPALYRRPIFNRCFASSYATVDNSVNLSTYVQAIALPAKFDAVQIGYVHLGGGGALTGMKALVAGTDDIGDMTISNTVNGKKFVTPWRGGVEKNSVASDGWQSVTWGGAASKDIADPGALNTTIAWSDVIPVEGIEDASHPGMYPLLVRLFPGTTFFTRCAAAGFSTPAKYLADCGNQYVLGASRNSDSVTTPGNWANAATPGFSDSSVLPLIIIGYTGSRRRTFMMVGDSRFGSAAPSLSATYGYKSLSFKLEQALIAKGIKTGLVSCSMGGQTSTTYQGRALQYLAQAAPDVAVYLVCSINDNGGAMTAATTQAQRARALAFIDRCAQIGVQPVLVSAFPYAGGYGANLTNVQALDAWVAGLGLPYISPLQIYGTATGDWQSGWNEDGPHMTDAGYSDLATRISNAMSSLLT